jgi:HEAT repeat protein
MSLGRTLDEKLATLDGIIDESDSDTARALLEKALAARQNAVVQKAARIIVRSETREHDASLRAAFARFMQGGAKADKGCLAKQAIVEALLDSDSRSDEVFLCGIRHVQMEPVWGGQDDVAVELRVACGLGLANTCHPDGLRELADLLADPEPMARAGAARAIGFAGRIHEGSLLLRLRCRIGDPDARVMQAAFASLLAMAPGEEIPFVVGFLAADDVEIAEAAAVALGESRDAAAFVPLRQRLEDTIDIERRTALSVAIAMLRCEDGWEYLLATIEEESGGAAKAAIGALAWFRHDEALVERIHRALAARGDEELEAFAGEALK